MRRMSWNRAILAGRLCLGFVVVVVVVVGLLLVVSAAGLDSVRSATFDS